MALLLVHGHVALLLVHGYAALLLGHVALLLSHVTLLLVHVAVSWSMWQCPGPCVMVHPGMVHPGMVSLAWSPWHGPPGSP